MADKRAGSMHTRVGPLRAKPVALIVAVIASLGVCAAAPEPTGPLPTLATPSPVTQLTASSDPALRLALYDLDPRLALAMDHHVLGSDFVGEILVESLAAVGDTFVAKVVIESTWFTRWPPSTDLSLTISDIGSYGNMLVPGARLVVLLAGGPYVVAPFTYRSNSIFRIGDDGAVTCTSGNPLFAVHETGFVCSIQAYMPGGPMNLTQMRASFASLRRSMATRLPELSLYYDGLHRTLAGPVSNAAIDRSRLENASFR